MVDRIKLAGIILVHWIVIICNIISFVVVPFILPIYVAVSIMSGIAALLSSRGECILTVLENKYRGRLGKPLIKGFLGHYIFRK